MNPCKTWLSENGVDVVSLTEGRLEETLKLMRESFYTDEPPAIAVQLQQCPEAIDELENLTIDTFKDRASVIAIKDGNVVGASFNKIQSSTSFEESGYFERYRDERCKTDVAKEYVDCMIRMDEKKDVFAHYNVDRSLEVMFLTTARRYRGQGIGRCLIRASEEVARSLRLPLVSVIFTSRASQRIGIALGWDQLITVPMKEHVFRGKPYSMFTGENDSQILMAKKLF